MYGMICPVLLHMVCLGRVLCVRNVMSCVITPGVFRTCPVCTECYVLCYYTWCV